MRIPATRCRDRSLWHRKRIAASPPPNGSASGSPRSARRARSGNGRHDRSGVHHARFAVHRARSGTMAGEGDGAALVRGSHRGVARRDFCRDGAAHPRRPESSTDHHCLRRGRARLFPAGRRIGMAATRSRTRTSSTACNQPSRPAAPNAWRSGHRTGARLSAGVTLARATGETAAQCPPTMPTICAAAP